jgi:hypothetical protein
MSDLNRRRLVLVLAAVVAGLSVAYLGASYVVYDKLSRTMALCRGVADSLDNTPAEFALPATDHVDTTPYLMPTFEDVRFASRGEAGITIAAFWIPADVEDETTAPAVVMVPGLEGCRRDPTNLLVAGMLHRHDVSVLLIDLRDHGDSTVEDGRFAGGTDEYRDVLGGWDWLVSRGIPTDRIGLVGFSLGAATVMIAFGEEPRVAAVWEDSSFGDIGEATRAELIRNGYPEFLEWGGLAFARLFGDDLRSKSPLEAAGRAGFRPVFITHGSLDDRLTMQWAYDLAAAVWSGGGRTEPWIVPGMGHTKALVRMPVEYERRLAEFFASALGTAAP